MSDKVNPEDIEVHYDRHGWGAMGVYVKGKLVWAQDYGADERVYELLGVEQVHDSDFMLGQQQWKAVAKTLQEIEDYTRERAAIEARIAKLEDEAETLRQQAKALRARA